MTDMSGKDHTNQEIIAQIKAELKRARSPQMRRRLQAELAQKIQDTK